MIKGDSTEYDLLEKWSSLNCDGFKTVEIGVREGLGSKIIMDNAENYMMHIGMQSKIYKNPVMQDIGSLI